MSRIGKTPVDVPSDVNISVEEQRIIIKGKLGQLEARLDDSVNVVVDDGKVSVTPANDSKAARSMWGTLRSIISNMVKGVTDGFDIRLVINGVGYKAAIKGKHLVLSLGYSHDVIYAIPEGVTMKCEKPTLLVISGADKQLIGQIAGEIIKLRPVEPYKGKGIYIEGSYIRRKEGKKK